MPVERVHMAWDLCHGVLFVLPCFVVEHIVCYCLCTVGHLRQSQVFRETGWIRSDPQFFTMLLASKNTIL